MNSDKLHYSYKIRKASINDANALFDIERSTYKTHYWSLKSFKSEIQSIHSQYIVCESLGDSNKVVAYAGFWIIGNEGHITTMVVSRNYQRNHIADILLYATIAISNKLEIKWLTLEVRVSNIPAVSLYKKFNFHQLGIRKNYYHNNNEDALILWTDDIRNLNYLNFAEDIITPFKNNFDLADILHYKRVRTLDV